MQAFEWLDTILPVVLLFYVFWKAGKVDEKLDEILHLVETEAEDTEGRKLLIKKLHEAKRPLKKLC